ncbi:MULTISPECIES: sarcosine oxidase subunit delta [Paracoccus]|uniref:sarcosine oxidase subunit delta n=1 Tax=Paracoccus TaxID=265 RepID=UPI001FB6EDAF|nr:MULTISPECIES: sarcosine oxidase subunit delta [Paracoccus]MCJ1902462.1 sarcosine oxidase subunit delta [Paracoccus versutus]MDF3907079.1 sarcosine oxidase subunit delta [Paracoccus sp. AS002]
MKIMTCPVNGPRNISEFQWLGPVHAEDEARDETLVERLFLAPNPMGVLREWWRHTPSNTVFIAERNLISDEILRTWLKGSGADKPTSAA